MSKLQRGGSTASQKKHSNHKRLTKMSAINTQDTDDPLHETIQERRHSPECVRMNYGPDGDDSTVEDDNASELATLHLLSKC